MYGEREIVEGGALSQCENDRASYTMALAYVSMKAHTIELEEGPCGFCQHHSGARRRSS